MYFFRFVAFLLLVGLLTVVGVNIYNAGVTAGINSDIGKAIVDGAAIPAGFTSSAYLGHPGFGFGGFLIGLFFLFLFFGLLRAAFGMGRMGGGRGPGGYGKWGRHSGWHDYMGSWHEEQHGKAPETPAPDKA